MNNNTSDFPVSFDPSKVHTQARRLSDSSEDSYNDDRLVEWAQRNADKVHQVFSSRRRENMGESEYTS